MPTAHHYLRFEVSPAHQVPAEARRPIYSVITPDPFILTLPVFLPVLVVVLAVPLPLVFFLLSFDYYY